jgi:hypothetical protein
MQLSDLSRSRLVSQQIANTNFSSAQEIVGWMGAMQAQDYAMAKWAVGVRLPGSTQAAIQGAIDSGQVLRTHVLRPTWHLVSAEDIHWMLALTAPRLKILLKHRHTELELSEVLVAKSNHLIENALRGGYQLKREELVALLTQAGIATHANQAYHLFLCAELEGILCSGADQDGKPTYALLPERVPTKKTMTKEEALARLAKTYFASRSPATLQDFGWWSGLTAQDARQALDLVKTNFVPETVANQTYWLSSACAKAAISSQETLYLLPAYDEFLISYQERGASLQQAESPRTVSENGIFRPVIVLDGQVIGIWKRKLAQEKVVVEVELFKPASQTLLHKIEAAAGRFAHFLGLETASVVEA